jgi:hypothetical protein
VHGCRLVAIEGTHASGKTTLVHALVSHYRAQGVLVGCTSEPARTSPFIDDIVIHDRGTFDLIAEVDLFGAQLTDQLRATRHLELLICDKTIINVLAYARLVLDTPAGSQARAVLNAMTQFCTAWAPIYDAVFYCADNYDQPADPMRAKVTHLQDATADAVLDACTDCGVALHHIPTGLTVDERVTWVSQQVHRVLNRPEAGR